MPSIKMLHLIEDWFHKNILPFICVPVEIKRLHYECESLNRAGINLRLLVQSS